MFPDPNGKKISNELRLNHEVDTFTCEFTTSIVGEHTIEIFIKNEKVDATPSFYTYDATKIKVGDIPPGHVGMPVEFVGKYFLTLQMVTCTVFGKKYSMVLNKCVDRINV